MKLLPYIRSYMQRPLVRPWALAGPVLVLILCLPMIRPLRQPDSGAWGDEEQMIAATVQAFVEQHTLAIDKSVFSDNPIALENDGHRYSPYPPMVSILLAPIYWVLLRQGLDYNGSLIFVHYILILVGMALPTAMCVAMTYRLGRMFELRRPLRVGLGLATVLASGLITYGVVMNRHAPAAALLLGAVTCISHLAATQHPYRDLLMSALAGLLAALAATVDPPAIVLGTLLCLVFLAMRWNAATRIGAVALFLAGGAPVILLNIVLLHSIGIPLQSVFCAPQPRGMPSLALPSVTTSNLDTATPSSFDDETDAEPAPSAIQAIWARAAVVIGRILEGAVGGHGLLSHYPILVLGVLGAVLAIHRNWTAATKALAGVTLLSSALLVGAFALQEPVMTMAYGTPWFIATAPAVLLWVGVWLKRNHRTQSWVTASCVVAFSVIVSTVGMIDPVPRRGYRGYSFAEASMRILSPPAASPATRPAVP